MIILGITHPISWNTGACLLIDGELKSMVEEERLNRVKFSPRMFPHLSIEYCLRQANIDITDVDYVAVGFEKTLDTVIPNLKSSPKYFGVLAAGYLAIHNSYNLFKIPQEIIRKNPIYLNHHICHANSAYYCSDFEDSNVISLDASGGSNAGLIGYYNGIELDVFETISNSTSWGSLYTAVTGLLGFRPHQDEYKVMGLASYGSADPDGLPFIDWNNELPVIDRKQYWKYRSHLRSIVNKNDPMSKMTQDIAATTQLTLEKVALKMLEWVTEKTGSRNLCMSGGTALNCTMNGILLRSGMIDNIYINPSSWDGGTALGAAIQVYIDKEQKRPKAGFSHPYWGPEYSDDEIEKMIKEYGVKQYHYSEDIAKDTAKILMENRVIGWFQGRQEVGPRALGARSILANPVNPEMKDLINVKIKGREPWRPFAPSIMQEHAHEFLEDYYPSPYMLITYKVKPEKRNSIISTVHVDDTCRPQTVTKEANNLYWNLINEFYKISGVPVVLNTSFNLADEPNVCTPINALKTFYRCGMDSVVIGNYIIHKLDGDYSGPHPKPHLTSNIPVHPDV